MGTDKFRFRPPGCELPPALRWTLARAYGPPESTSRVPALAPAERSRALRWSRSLALVERIATRLPRARAEADLGAETADQMWRARDALAARSLLLQQLLDKTAGRAAELDCPLVALKGIALLESGTATWGGRPLVDLDLLVAPDQAAGLAASLRAIGLHPSGSDERHHLPPLADPRLGELEMHLTLPGLSLGGAAVTPARLRAAGLAEPSERLPSLLLPAPALLAAHLIAHAVDQHGLSPTAYPITRLAADLLDLAAALGMPIERLALDAAPLLGKSVSRREAAAVVALCGQLAAGPDGLSRDTDARALLDHSIAAFTRPAYRRSLRRRAALKALGRGDWRKLRPRSRPATKK